MSISTDSAKLYDLEITFHSARSLPISDIPSFSADPYILASVRVPSYAGREDPGPPPLLFRTRTIHGTRDPEWGNEVWRIGGIPGAGFVLRVAIRDEDAGKKDDRLGEARISFLGQKPVKDGERSAEEDWGQVRNGMNVERKEASVKKRRGGIRAIISTFITAAFSRSVSKHGGNVVISVKVLGLSQNQKDRRPYTLGPHYYSIHFSPLLGRMIGTKSTNASNSQKAEVSNFQANKLQLTGPVPKDLEHKYVGYRPFIESAFSKSGIQGRLLNRALKKQHRYIYSYDHATVYGCVDRRHGTSNASDKHDSEDNLNILAAQFLHMTQHGSGYRLYTYVITLDGQWRFTETGDEFAVEMLSKHSMHADAARYIAYSGEFFVRRIGTKGWEEDLDEQQDAQLDAQEDGAGKKHNKHETRPTKAIKKAEHRPPSQYELVIDNDSGTYRPNKDLLPLLAEYLGNEANLGGPGGLGKISAMDGFDEGLKDTKKRRGEAKKQHKPREERERPPMVQLRRGSSLSSQQAAVAGLGRRSMSSSDIERMVDEQEEGADEDGQNMGVKEAKSEKDHGQEGREAGQPSENQIKVNGEPDR
ncbi:C2 protein, partial [Rhizoctonia solani]